MTSELKKARRELARLTAERDALNDGALGVPFTRTAKILQRMARDLSRQIKRQELECRRLATLGNCCWVYDSGEPNWACANMHKGWRVFTGKNAMRRAVTWAEKQNRKGKT